MTSHFSQASVIPLTLLLALSCQPAANPMGADNESASEVGSSAPAATVNGQPITMSELDDYIRDELFKRATGSGDPSKLYEVRARHIEPMLNNRAIEDAAAAVQLSPDAFLEQELARVSEVSDEEVAAYYEENSEKMGGASLEQVAPRIRSYMVKQRETSLVAELRENAETAVLLEPARNEVAAIGPAKGPGNAPVTIVEFSDFQCPYCQRVVPTINEIHQRYPDQVRIVFSHLPLDSIHARARPAAEASACADEQGKFWEYHDLMFENNRALGDEDLERYAAEVGLEMDGYRQCVSDRRYQELVQTDAEAAAENGISGTPGFFVNGIKISGAKPLSEFVTLIDAELQRAKADPSKPAS